MWKIDVLQYQWLVMGLMGGLVVLLGVVLIYLAIWRQREAEFDEETVLAAKQNAPVKLWLVAFMPWFLLVVYAGFAIYSVIYVLYMASRPPNW